MDVSAKYLLAWIEICRAINTWNYLATIILNSHLNSDSTSISQIIYRTRAIITRSWFETALDYKPRILGPKKGQIFLFST